MLLHDDEDEDDVLCSIDLQVDFASSSDFVVKTQDSDPILISLGRSKWDHREKMSWEPAYRN